MFSLWTQGRQDKSCAWKTPICAPGLCLFCLFHCDIFIVRKHRCVLQVCVFFIVTPWVSGKYRFVLQVWWCDVATAADDDDVMLLLLLLLLMMMMMMMMMMMIMMVTLMMLTVKLSAGTRSSRTTKYPVTSYSVWCHKVQLYTSQTRRDSVWAEYQLRGRRNRGWRVDLWWWQNTV